jgi:hypothetical protein
MGVDGRSTVRDAIAEQQITATPDAPELTNGALEAGQPIRTGADARAFADVMEHHALQSTEGRRYAEMGRLPATIGICHGRAVSNAHQTSVQSPVASCTSGTGREAVRVNAPREAGRR